MRRLLFLALGLAGCAKGAAPETDQGPLVPDAASSIPSASAAAPAIALDASAAPGKELLTFVGMLGTRADTRIALERAGNDLTMAMDTSTDKRSFRGAMKDTTHFVVTEIVKGRAPATFEGELTASGLTGQSKEPDAKKSLAFAGVPITVFDASSTFDESYVGSLGGKIRIRMKLTRSGEKLTGVYRYARSKEDLRLVGTVIPDGHFALQESSANGQITGKFQGIFLRRSAAIGDWSSPDGKHSFVFALQRGDAYPETLTLGYGGRLSPQEDHREAANCVAETIFPQVVDLKSKAAETALNPKLRDLGGGGAAKGPMTCEGATAELPWSTESGYEVTAQRDRYVGITFSSSGFAGGAHGFGASTCRVIDLETGNVVALSPLLTADGRAKMSKLVTEKIKKAQNLKSLTEGGFFDDVAKVSPDTNVCFAKNGVEVLFNDYEIAPHVVGPTDVQLTKNEVRAFFGKSELTDALFK
ncbi:MAG: RsiV family protein [Polyangiaceae bacterium]